MHKNRQQEISIGWASRDVTPDRPVILGAQFNMRASEGVDSPFTVTAMAISSADPEGDSVIFVSCDRGVFRHKWYEQNNFLPLCRDAIRARSSEIDVNKGYGNSVYDEEADAEAGMVIVQESVNLVNPHWQE